MSNNEIEKKKLTRKCKAHPENWKKNAAKKARVLGTAHGTTYENFIPERKIGPACTNCRFHCGTKITALERLNLFKEYWSLGDHTRQWDYIDKLIEVDKETSNSDEKHFIKKRLSRKFCFNLQSRKIKVCRNMFLNTFGK